MWKRGAHSRETSVIRKHSWRLPSMQLLLGFPKATGIMETHQKFSLEPGLLHKRQRPLRGC